jgi:hypothetical protein
MQPTASVCSRAITLAPHAGCANAPSVVGTCSFWPRRGWVTELAPCAVCHAGCGPAASIRRGGTGPTRGRGGGGRPVQSRNLSQALRPAFPRPAPPVCRGPKRLANPTHTVSEHRPPFRRPQAAPVRPGRGPAWRVGVERAPSQPAQARLDRNRSAGPGPVGPAGEGVSERALRERSGGLAVPGTCQGHWELGISLSRPNGPARYATEDLSNVSKRAGQGRSEQTE